MGAQRLALLVPLGCAALGLNATGIHAQVCDLPDAVRALVPVETPGTQLYETRWVTGAEGASVPLGVGHLHRSEEGPVLDLPPGAYDWLSGATLPLSASPDEPPFAWVAAGWIVSLEEPPRPLSRLALVETGYGEPSFIVLETRDDGAWLRVRVGEEGRDRETAWVPGCAVTNSAAVDFTEWGEWLMSDNISPLFFRTETPGPLYAEPGSRGTALDAVGPDYSLEPIEVRGEWMRVTVKEPSDYCAFDLEPSQREAWVRWTEPDRGPLLWYFTRGC